MKKAFVFLLLAALPFLSLAERWKSYRYDVLYGVGATNFLGDLGGANSIATHVLKDLNWSSTRPALSIGMRYRLNEYMAVRSNICLGRVYGDDSKTKEPFRQNRNLSFASNIYEFNTNLEVAFMREQIGRKYRLRGVHGRRGFELYSYGFVGLGVFYFNPVALDDANTWIKLQPLHTEGQGLIPSRKEYHRVAVSLPVGIGFKYGLNRRYSIGIQYGLHYTLTDYIDDVSTTYVNPDILAAQANGDLATKMANRTLKLIPNATDPGQQRGDPKYNDAYMFALITLNYKLRTTRKNLPKF
jgi:hypothetical protein